MIQETVKSFSISGKHFISGLVWESPIDRLLLSGKKKALRQEYQYICQYRLGKNNLQIGLVPKEDSQACDIGYFSFAATMASYISKPHWIGVFQVSLTLYALVAVRNGFIMAGQDIVGEAEQISKVFKELIDTMVEMGDSFEHVFAPEEWDVPDSENINVRRLLTDKKNRNSLVMLRAISGNHLSQKNIRNCILAGVSCAILATGYIGYRYYQYQHEKMKKEIIMRTKIIPPPHEWEYMPLFSVQLEHWQKMIEQLPLVFDGWELTRIHVTNGEITFCYLRSEMLSADSFSKKARARFGGTLTFDKEGNTATIVKTFKPLTDENAETLLNNMDVNIKFYSWLQHMTANNIFFDKIPVVLPSVPATPEKDIIYKWGRIDWEKYKWKMDIPLNIEPYILFQGKQLSGLRLSSMYCNDIRADGWHLEGYFYANK
ncbi:type 4b pilus protein PilO2 [Salmonella enterica]|nr:type 4b pilus protein PilO2 [Salmonella enterica]